MDTIIKLKIIDNELLDVISIFEDVRFYDAVERRTLSIKVVLPDGVLSIGELSKKIVLGELGLEFFKEDYDEEGTLTNSQTIFILGYDNITSITRKLGFGSNSDGVEINLLKEVPISE